MSPLDNPAFRRWFGDSKVVDERGEPLVVYHGTAADFDTFDSSRYGEASDAGTLGSGFYFTSLRDAAESYAVAAAEKSGGIPRVVEAYLRIQRPYVAPRRIWNLSRDLPAARKHSASLRRQGFDGVVFRIDLSILGDPSFTEYVVFDPRQIKSATDNVGTYDPSDPSILRGLSAASPATAYAEKLASLLRQEGFTVANVWQAPGVGIRVYLAGGQYLSVSEGGDLSRATRGRETFRRDLLYPSQRASFDRALAAYRVWQDRELAARAEEQERAVESGDWQDVTLALAKASPEQLEKLRKAQERETYDLVAHYLMQFADRARLPAMLRRGEREVEMNFVRLPNGTYRAFARARSGR